MASSRFRRARRIGSIALVGFHRLAPLIILGWGFIAEHPYLFGLGAVVMIVQAIEEGDRHLTSPTRREGAETSVDPRSTGTVGDLLDPNNFDQVKRWRSSQPGDER